MTAREAVARARSMVARDVVYRLGAGGVDPKAPTPTTGGACDCSGFVAWCLGVSRKTDHPLYASWNGGWLETSAIVRDIKLTGAGLFLWCRTWDAAAPGDLLVYGDAGGHQGHVGMIVQLAPKGRRSLESTRVVHCSLGNYRTTGKAVQETSAAPTFRRALVGRYAGFLP